MKRNAISRRKGIGPITLGRASRLHHMITILRQGPLGREELLKRLGIGLRTFYREIELLKRCRVKMERQDKLYKLKGSPEDAEGRLPFPDPQLSFAEMAELSSYPGEAARRLGALLASVITHADVEARPGKAVMSKGKGTRSKRNVPGDKPGTK